MTGNYLYPDHTPCRGESRERNRAYTSSSQHVSRLRCPSPAYCGIVSRDRPVARGGEPVADAALPDLSQLA